MLKFTGIAVNFLDAADTAAQQPDALSSILSLVLPIGVFIFVAYFLLYRPQKKQEKTVSAMRNGLRVGDEISTNGGIIGKIVQIKDDFVVIETSMAKTKMKIAKWGVRAVEYREEDGQDGE